MLVLQRNINMTFWRRVHQMLLLKDLFHASMFSLCLQGRPSFSIMGSLNRVHEFCPHDEWTELLFFFFQSMPLSPSRLRGTQKSVHPPRLSARYKVTFLCDMPVSVHVVCLKSLQALKAFRGQSDSVQQKKKEGEEKAKGERETWPVSSSERGLFCSAPNRRNLLRGL